MEPLGGWLYQPRAKNQVEVDMGLVTGVNPADPTAIVNQPAYAGEISWSRVAVPADNHFDPSLPVYLSISESWSGGYPVNGVVWNPSDASNTYQPGMFLGGSPLVVPAVRDLGRHPRAAR